MKEYHKIETIFERDMEGSKKLIEGRYRNEIVEYLTNKEWVFTEKVDGTNIRVHWDGHKVVFNGRTDNSSIPSNLVTKLNELFLGETNAQIFEQNFADCPVTIYGEGYGEKIQSGENYCEGINFIVFDIEVGNTFLKREDVEKVAKYFNLACVPVLPITTIKEAVDYIKTKPMSVLACKEKEMEGVVGTPTVRIYDVKGNRIIVKIKARDFN